MCGALQLYDLPLVGESKQAEECILPPVVEFIEWTCQKT